MLKLVRSFSSSPAPRVLVIGGHGALGSAVIQTFKSHGWNIVNADFRSDAPAGCHQIDLSLKSWEQQIASIHNALSRDAPVNAVVCTAGGWSGGHAASDVSSLINSFNNMYAQCLQSSLTAARMAATHMTANGTLVLTGSAAALGPTPGMLAYGCFKAATHHIVKSLAAPGSDEHAGKEGKLPLGSKAIAVVPHTIDTPSNRKGMPGADVSSWTPTSAIAEKIFEVVHGTYKGGKGAAAVPTGALLEPVTAGGKTTWNLLSA